MRRLALTLCFASIVLSTAVLRNARGQSSALIQGPQRDPQALALVKQALAAAGWSSLSNSATNFTASGTITYFESGGQVSGPATVYGRGTRQFRLDAQLPQGTRSIILNDSGGTLKDPAGQVNDVTHLQVRNLGILTFPYPALAEAASDLQTGIVYVGTNEVSGRQANQIRIWHRIPYQVDLSHVHFKPASTDYFLDAQSGLVLRTVDTSHPVDPSWKEYPHEINFGNYKEVNGVNAPMTISEISRGQTLWELQLTSFAFNTGLEVSTFNWQ